MANEQTKLQAELRTEQGSVPAGRLRRAGFIPAAVNRIGGDTTLVKLNMHAFQMAMRDLASQQVLVSLELEGSSIPVIIREVQYNVINDNPIHIDFGEISLKEKLRVAIPITLVGEAVGVETDGGMMAQDLREVEVECLPQDIVEAIELDVSGLQIAQSLSVADLTLNDALTLLTDPQQVIVSIMPPKVEEPEEVEEAIDQPELIEKDEDADSAE